MAKGYELSELFFSRTKDFLGLYLESQQQRSRETIKAYRIALSDFYEYVTVVKGQNVMRFRFTDCTYEFVLSYSQYLREEEHLANSTVNQRLAALKSYLRYVSDEDISLMQVYMGIQKVPPLKTPKLQREVMEKEDLKAFLDEPPDTVKGNRDRALLILLYDSAVRVSELSGAVIGDLCLDVSHPYITVHGKGKKTRSIALSARCAGHVREYIKREHDPDDSPDTPLFYTVIHGEKHHMSQRNIERIVKKYADRVRLKHPTMPDSCYPHMLRRSRATGMYRDGVPLEMISAILGHVNPETTKIYAIPSVDQMREALEKGQSDDNETEKIWDGKEDEIRKMFGLG